MNLNIKILILAISILIPSINSGIFHEKKEDNYLWLNIKFFFMNIRTIKNNF